MDVGGGVVVQSSPAWALRAAYVQLFCPYSSFILQTFF